MLAGSQLAMNRIDWQSKQRDRPHLRARPAGALWKPAASILALAVVAFFARVASRWYIFNAGRDAEYELRFELLRKLHQLGAAFYRTMPAGEIMSRSTSDLQQVRMLFGFGVLNVVRRRLRFRERAPGHARVTRRSSRSRASPTCRSSRSSRAPSRSGLYTRMRENQASLGRMSDVLQANLAGVRVVRSFALEDARARPLRGGRTASTSTRASPSRGCAARSRRPSARSRRSGMLVFFWYGSTLLLRGPRDGGLSQGQFFAFWIAFARMTWPMIAVGFALSIVQRGRAGLRAAARRVRRGARGGRRSAPGAAPRRRARYGRAPRVRVRRARRCSTT